MGRWDECDEWEGGGGGMSGKVCGMGGMSGKDEWEGWWLGCVGWVCVGSGCVSSAIDR